MSVAVDAPFANVTDGPLCGWPPHAAPSAQETESTIGGVTAEAGLTQEIPETGGTSCLKLPTSMEDGVVSVQDTDVLPGPLGEDDDPGHDASTCTSLQMWHRSTTSRGWNRER